MSNKFVMRYPGQAMMFNMARAGRLKKSTNTAKKESDSIMSETWTNEDADNYLIIRLVNNDYPWLVVHHGIFEIIKCPLLVPIVSEELSDTLSILLRDHANRGNAGIKRTFLLQFNSIVEAQSFKFAHNSMIKEYRNLLRMKAKKNKKKHSRNAYKKKRYYDSSSSSDEEDETTDNSSLRKEEKEKAVSSPPSILMSGKNTKRRMSNSERGMNEGSRKKKKAKIEDEDDEEGKEFEAAVTFFHQQDEATILDDICEFTPNPFG